MSDDNNNKFNKLHFTVNLREKGIACLIKSLQRLQLIELIAESRRIRAEAALDDYDRTITLFVLSAELFSLIPLLKTLDITPTLFSACDPVALSMAKDFGFSVEDMSEEANPV